MAYKYTSDSLLGVSLNVSTPKPLDIRSVVNSLNDLYSLPSSSAYEGMLVGNLEDGNIYMLLDKSNINNKSGWRASYEYILILSCTYLDYQSWANNTTEDYNPVDLSLPYLHKNTYYYIYEDSIENLDEQSYVSQALLSALELSLSGSIRILLLSISDFNNEITTLKTNLEVLTARITALEATN